MEIGKLGVGKIVQGEMEKYEVRSLYLKHMICWWTVDMYLRAVDKGIVSWQVWVNITSGKWINMCSVTPVYFTSFTNEKKSFCDFLFASIGWKSPKYCLLFKERIYFKVRQKKKKKRLTSFHWKCTHSP